MKLLNLQLNGLTKIVKNIYFNTPPLFYNYSHITKLQNALISNNFSINDYDVNYEIYLENIDDYLNTIKHAAKKI